MDHDAVWVLSRPCLIGTIMDWTGYMTKKTNCIVSDLGIPEMLESKPLQVNKVFFVVFSLYSHESALLLFLWGP
jgi:hypothetical protein